MTGGTVRWSDEFLEARLASALVRYLAVAHFGRGRGDFQVAEAPEPWREAVGTALPRARQGTGHRSGRTCARTPTRQCAWPR